MAKSWNKFKYDQNNARPSKVIFQVYKSSLKTNKNVFVKIENLCKWAYWMSQQ